MRDIVKRIYEYRRMVKSSYRITDAETLSKFNSDPDFPYLISFPRTGSHWLRNIMELYFEKPSLIRVFYYKNPKDFTCIHVHDEDLKVQRKNIIYLYRHPLPTIYSQMSYWKEDLSNQERVRHWSTQYAQHLDKWMFSTQGIEKRTLITYENLKNNYLIEFQKVCSHFDVEFNEVKALKVKDLVSKETIKQKVREDSNVINLAENYETARKEFALSYTDLIYRSISEVNEELVGLFEWENH